MKKYIFLLIIGQYGVGAQQFVTPFAYEEKAEEAVGLQLLTLENLLLLELQGLKYRRLNPHIFHRSYIDSKSQFEESLKKESQRDPAIKVILTTLQEASKVGPNFSTMVHHFINQKNLNKILTALRIKGIAECFNFMRLHNRPAAIPDTNIVAKGEIEYNAFKRLVNTLRARECIKREKLSTLSVPDKFPLFNVTDNTWYLFTEKAQTPDGNYYISLPQLKDLLCFVSKTGLYDFFDVGNNIKLNPQNTTQLMFIDLEDRSFEQKPKFDLQNKFSTKQEDSVLRYLSSHPFLTITGYLPEDNTLDPEGLNLEKALNEYEKYKEQS